MKLSEAIRLSIGVFNEQREIFMCRDGYGGVPGPCGCALGTAAYSVGMRVLMCHISKELAAHFPILLHKVSWPIFGHYFPMERELRDWISVSHFRGMSREAIADRVEQLERELEAQQVSAPETIVGAHEQA